MSAPAAWALGEAATPPGDDVHVWLVDLAVDAAEEAAIGAALSPDERARASRFVQPRDARRFRVARGALRRLLGDYLGIAPAAVPLGAAPGGKPRLEAPWAGALEFNVSHSGEVALVAVAGRPVGIDVEAVRPMRDLAGLWRLVASPVEALRLESLPESEHPAAFFRVWARKEAWLKATGEGLSRPLPDLEVSFLPHEAPALVHVAGLPDAARRWAIVALPVDGHEAALAIDVAGGGYGRLLLRKFSTRAL